MNKKQIISKVEEILHKKYDTGSIDSELVEDCINNTLEAINYNQSYTELIKQNLELKEKLIKTNSFLKKVVEMIGIETDGLGNYGITLSLDDCKEALDKNKTK